MAGPWEQFQTVEQGPWSQFAPVQPLPEEKESVFRQVADVPLGVAKGAVQGVRMLADVFGAGSETSNTIRSAETYLAGLMSAQAKNDQQEIARIMKEAEDKGVLDQVKAGIKAFTIAPVDTLSSALGTAAPVVAASLGATVLGAPAVVGTGVGALLGAGMGAGVVKGSIYEETKKALIEAGAAEADAEQKAQLAQSYGGKNLDQILLGTALGGVAAVGPLEKGAAGILARNILGKAGVEEAAETAGEQAVKGALRRRAEAGLLEAAPEAVQAGQEQVAQNIALQREGFDVPTFRGVASASTLEAIAGGGLGATVGGGAPEVVKPEVETIPPVAPEAAAPEVVTIPPEPPEVPAITYSPDPLISFPDGTVARKGEYETYIASLPEEQQVEARAKMIGMGQEAVEIKPEMLISLGIRPRAPIVQRLAGLEINDPKVVEELTEFAKQPYASPQTRGNIFGFLATIKPKEIEEAQPAQIEQPTVAAPIVQEAPAIQPTVEVPQPPVSVEPSVAEDRELVAPTPALPLKEAAVPKVGDFVKLTVPGVGGPIGRAGKVEQILPSGDVEIRTQQGDIVSKPVGEVTIVTTAPVRATPKAEASAIEAGPVTQAPTIITAQVLTDLGVKPGAAIVKRLEGKPIDDPEVVTQLESYAKRYAPAEIKPAITNFVQTIAAPKAAPVAPPPPQKQVPQSDLSGTVVGGAPVEMPSTTEPPGAGPAITEQDEYERAVVEANKAERRITRLSKSLWGRLRGQLPMQDVRDVSPDKKFRSLGNARRGTSLSTLVADGSVDEFLPPDMRHDSPNFDEYDSTEYIKDRLREGTYIDFDAQMATQQIASSVEQLEASIDALQQEKEVNDLIQDAIAEQARAASEAESIEPSREATGTRAVSAEQEVEAGLESYTAEEIKSKQAVAKAEEKRISGEEKAAEQKAKVASEVSEFDLTGSDRPADANKDQGAMFSVNKGPDKASFSLQTIGLP